MYKISKQMCKISYKAQLCHEFPKSYKYTIKNKITMKTSNGIVGYNIFWKPEMTIYTVGNFEKNLTMKTKNGTASCSNC